VFDEGKGELLEERRGRKGHLVESAFFVPLLQTVDSSHLEGECVVREHQRDWVVWERRTY